MLTRGAVGVRDGEAVEDLAGAAVWGLVRSAQSENPGRLVLVDLDSESDVPWNILAAALALDEPQLAVREGELAVPRLQRADTGLGGALDTSRGLSGVAARCDGR